MTLECKLPFFTLVAAPAQTHETSLTHTQTKDQNTVLDINLTNISLMLRSCEGTFVARLSEAIHLNLSLTLFFFLAFCLFLSPEAFRHVHVLLLVFHCHRLAMSSTNT